MTGRENASAKGRRLLAEGRLLIEVVDGQKIRASCRGDSGEVYRLGHDPAAGWRCGCPARTRCSHLVGLMLVVAPREGEAA